MMTGDIVTVIGESTQSTEMRDWERAFKRSTEDSFFQRNDMAKVKLHLFFFHYFLMNKGLPFTLVFIP